MNEKALRILEYPKIIDMLTGYASSLFGFRKNIIFIANNSLPNS